MRARWLVMIALLLSGLVSTVTPRVHANTINVPGPTGPTIQAAIDSAGPGDTVSVSPGTYSEDLVIKTPLIHVVGVARDTTVIKGQGAAAAVWINASNVQFTGFTVLNSNPAGWAVHVERAANVNVTGNVVGTNSGDGEGVNIYNTSNALVDGNVFSDNLYAVNVTGSDHVRVSNNQAVTNDVIGVQLLESSSCLVFNNSFVGGEDGMDILQGSFNNSISRNLIKDMSIDGVSLGADSNRVPVSGLPQNNTLNENTFERNHIGVNLQNETLNTLYHNDFFQSGFRHVNPVEESVSFPDVVVGPNSWDNSSLGGFVGGNYWDDYNFTGADVNPHDGIGDTAYVIGRGNQDSRPLMAPFRPVPVLIQSVAASPANGRAPLSVNFTVTIVGSLAPFSYLWSFSDGSSPSSSQNPEHVFPRTGNYSVMVTVRDSSGATDYRVITVRVLALEQSPSYGLWILVGGVAGLAAAIGLLVWRRRRKAGPRTRKMG